MKFQNAKKFPMKSLSVAVALLSMGAAHATVQTFSVGAAPATVVDPAGSGRLGRLEILSGGGTLTFSNPGYQADAFSAQAISGAVGALNTGAIFLTGGGGVQVQEGWKSYAQSGPGFETVFFPTKTAADNDPQNAQYYATGEISQTNPAIGTGSFRVKSAAAAPVNSISAKVDDLNNGVGESSIPVGSIVTAISSGYAIQTGVANAALTGGEIKVDNIVFDLYNGKVNATVSGTRYAAGKSVPLTTYAPQSMTLWTFAGIAAGGADIVGPTGVNPADLLAPNAVDRLTNPALCGTSCYTLLSTDNSGTYPLYTVKANTSISNLAMTTEGVNFFKTVLNTTQTGTDALVGVNNAIGKWGSVASELTLRVGELAQPVPEPSTYALMGLGLVGISLVARRRKAA